MLTRIFAGTLTVLAIADCASPEQRTVATTGATASRMDKKQILIELAESPRTQFGKVAWDQQTNAQKVFSVIWELESEVNNGGFWQYFGNSSGDLSAHAVPALRTIGAHRTADIVAEALRVFPGGVPPADRESREQGLADASPALLAQWDRLDQQFFAYPDDLTSLLYEWVKVHPKEFGPFREAA